jgi:hypothetical protein
MNQALDFCLSTFLDFYCSYIVLFLSFSIYFFNYLNDPKNISFFSYNPLINPLKLLSNLYGAF